jgi:hypothetical protein
MSPQSATHSMSHCHCLRSSQRSSVITAALYYSLLPPVVTDFPLSAHTTFVITVCIVVAAPVIGALIISAVSYSDIYLCSIVLLFQAIISPAPSGLTGIIRAWAEGSSQTMQGTISLRQCCVSTLYALALCCTMSFG